MTPMLTCIQFHKLGFGEFVGEKGSVWNSIDSMQHYLQRHPSPPGSSAFVIGSQGLKAAMRELGMLLVHPDGPSPVEREFGPHEMSKLEVCSNVRTVVVGFDRTFCYFSLAYAVRCLLENEGCRLVVTNRDFQFPASGKRLPGTGAVVAAICAGANREPDAVTAKPSRVMLDLIMAEAGVTAERTLMVGDMWSDIAFGHRAGASAALVLSGVASAEDAARWKGDMRPDGIFTDIRGLISPTQVVRPLETRAADYVNWVAAARGVMRPKLSIVVAGVFGAAAIGFLGGLVRR